MNRAFGVPALAGTDRLKAGHQTWGVPLTSSWSQWTVARPRGLSMNLVAATVKWRQILLAVNQPPRHRGSYGSWSQCIRKNQKSAT